MPDIHIHNEFKDEKYTVELEDSLEEAKRQIKDFEKQVISLKGEIDTLNEKYSDLAKKTGFKNLTDELNKFKDTAWKATEEFSAFLQSVNLEDYAKTDSRFSDLFSGIRNGAITTSEAITRVKAEYASLFEENFAKTSGAFDTQVIQQFIASLNKVESTLDIVLEKVNRMQEVGTVAVSGGGASASGSTANLAEMLEKIQSAADNMTDDVKQAYDLITNLVKAVSDFGGLDENKLYGVSHSFENLAKVGSARLGDKTLKNIRALVEYTKSMSDSGISSGKIDLSWLNDLNVNASSWNALGNNLPKLTKKSIDTDKLTKLSHINFKEIQSFQLKGTSLERLADRLRDLSGKSINIDKLKAIQKLNFSNFKNLEIKTAPLKAISELIGTINSISNAGRDAIDSGDLGAEARLKRIADVVRSLRGVNLTNLNSFGMPPQQVAETTVYFEKLEKILKETGGDESKLNAAIKSNGMTIAEVDKAVSHLNTTVSTTKEALQASGKAGNVTLDQLKQISTEMHGLLSKNQGMSNTSEYQNIQKYVSVIDDVIEKSVNGTVPLIDALQNVSNAPQDLVKYFGEAKSAVLDFRNAMSKAPGDSDRLLKGTADAIGSINKYIGDNAGARSMSSYKTLDTLLGDISTRFNSCNGDAKAFWDSFTKDGKDGRAELNKLLAAFAVLKKDMTESSAGNLSLSQLAELARRAQSAITDNGKMSGTDQYNDLVEKLNAVRSVIDLCGDDSGKLNEAFATLGINGKNAFDALKTALSLFNEQASRTNKLTQAEMNKNMNDYYSAMVRNSKAMEKWGHAQNSNNDKSREAMMRLKAAAAEMERASAGADKDSDASRRLAEAVRAYNEEYRRTEVILRKNGDATKSITERLKDLSNKFGIWFSVSRVVMAVVRSIRQMITTSIELDSVMAQMQIVTRASNAEMKEFGKSAAEAARRVGSSIKDFTDSATTFARLGYNTSESSILAEYTTMLQNVGDIDVKDAQDAITAIIKAFGKDASDVESIMDKLVTTGNNFPISVSQIAEGMNNASSALAAAGNTFEQSVALLTAANTTIQNASKSSTGLRTIAARLRNTKNELDELGESFESDAKYEELVNGLTKANVTLKTATGEFRSTYDIIADIAKVWDQLTSMEQAGLATAISGTRQQAVFFSLVEQFKEASGAMDAMTDSAGALNDAYSVYMDTVQAHINQFKAAFESLSQTAVDSGVATDIVDIGQKLLVVVERVFRLIDAIGGLKAVIFEVVTITALFNHRLIVSAIETIILKVWGVVDAVKAANAAWMTFQATTMNGGLGIGVWFKALMGSSAGVKLAIVGAVAALTLLVFTIKKVKDAINEANPSLDKLKENYEEQKTKLDELKDKLSENEDRIKELNKLNESGGLNIVEQDELDRLTTENDLLEHQILLQQEEVDTANKLAAAKAKASAEEYLSNDRPFEYYTGDGHGGAYENHRINKGAGAVLNLLDDYNGTKDVEEQSRILGKLADKRRELLKLRNDLMLDEEGNAEQISGVDELIDKIDLLTDRAGVFNRVFNRFFKDGGFTDEKVKEFTEYLERIGYDTKNISKESLIEYFDGVGRASEESAESLKDAVDQLEKLADVEKNFDSISGAISDYEKNGFVSAQKFQSLEEVYGSTDGWEEFKRVLSDTKSTIDDVRAASNKLAENWVNSNGKIRDALNGVTEENADATKAMLENMGVVNAEALVEQALTAKRLEAQAASMGLTDATWEEVSAKLAAAGASKDALGALEAYRKQQVSAKLETMNFTTATKDSISALYAQAAAANASQRALGAIQSVQAIKNSTAGLDRKSSAYGNAMRAMAQYQNIVKEEFSAAIPDTIVAPKVIIPSSGGGSSSKGGSSAAKDLELYTAEIERYREELEKLSRIRIHKEDLNFAIEEEKDLEKKVNLYHAILTAYSEEQKSLERLQALRRKDISSGVADLRGMGFSVEYSAKNDELFIRNKEHINELYGKNTEETNELRKAAEALIKDLEDLNKENQEGTDTWQELGKAANSAKVAMIDTLKEIVTNASGAVDAIQNVYSTLHKAADEFAANGGFISVDTFQEIIGLGAQYMQYLTDENGLLVINEDSINKVIAAKTEELALDTAMSYVERLRLAMQDDSVESLNELLYATQDTANATWDLVYANLKMLGLNDQQYAAALHNINGIRAMARAAINGVGHVAGEALEELKNMEKGTGDILKYVMDMLKQRIQDEIDALEDLKDQFGDLIDLKKESLKATKEESDYQKKVAQRIKEIAKLQAQIDALSLDNSRESQARRAKLLEELAQMQEDLDNEQTEHAISAQEESLDKMKEMYDAEKDEEIKTLEDTISSYQKLYDMA